jgi:hypothetical protein
MSGRQVHRTGTTMLSLAMVAIGIALVVEVFGGDGGVISTRLIVGVLFLGAGSGRLYIETRRGGPKT